jgi:hypothetical protein
MRFSKTSLASGLLLAGNTLAIDLDLDDEGSIRNAAATIAASIVQRYTNATDVPGGIPGLLGPPYYFWEHGLAWDSLINYWYQTGDASYNELIGQALRHQLGENYDYMPANQTKSEGNDDQSTWALAAMTAAESGFPSDVLADLNTTWADIAIDVFNQQAARWDYETCAGGLRWQIYPFNNGYDYKNSISNGNFYQLAARLSRFTGNSTYEEWSDRVLGWSVNVGLIADEDTDTPGAVYDGTDITTECSDLNHVQWSANAGTYLAGAAYAWNAVSPGSTLFTSLHSGANQVLTNPTPDPNPLDHAPRLPPPLNNLHLRLRPSKQHQRHAHRNRLRALQHLQHRPTRLPRHPRARPRPNPRSHNLPPHHRHRLKRFQHRQHHLRRAIAVPRIRRRFTREYRFHPADVCQRRRGAVLWRG